MQPIKPLSKQQVRDFMAKRQKDKTAPPSLEEMRRILGRDLIEAEREAAR